MGTPVKAEQGAPAPKRDPWVTLNQAPTVCGRGQRAVLIAALKGVVRYEIIAGRPVFHRDDLETLGAEPDDGDAE